MKTSMQRHSVFFQLACQVLKYFLLGVFGFTLVCLLSSAFGTLRVTAVLMSYFEAWFLRLAVMVISCMSAAIVCESLRR